MQRAYLKRTVVPTAPGERVALTSTPPNPVEDSRRVGTVTAATAQSVTINLPNAASGAAVSLHGEAVPRGEVGEYVCIPNKNSIVLGRIAKVELPERDRLGVEPKVGPVSQGDPIGYVTLLTDVRLPGGEVTGAIAVPPRLGTPAYSAPSAFLRWVLEASARGGRAQNTVALSIGEVAGVPGLPVTISPERLFGRHCAVLGVTGGGKSWTIATLLEECARYACKAILIDATGEFASLGGVAQHLSLGSEKDAPLDSIECACPHHRLEERDLFALFTPSGQSQAPTLREAIRSLKLADCGGLPAGLVEAGCIPKSGRSKKAFLDAARTHASTLESASASFNVELLSRQVELECVWPSGGTLYKPDDSVWGGPNQAAVGYCLSLVVRIESSVKANSMRAVFRPGTLPSVHEEIDKFLKDDTKRILRISLRYLSFSHNVRPIIVNAIGRHLLAVAREKRCAEKPVVVLLDEAHQFLGQTVGDEANAYYLDAFDLLAKEGRKYGLTVCLATQRPRDIQEGVLSQMGAMIVHRLAHSADRDVVERAARDVEKSVAALLPTLSQGHALLIGADFPVPVPIHMRPPRHEPDSRGPDYQRFWRTD